MTLESMGEHGIRTWPRCAGDRSVPRRITSCIQRQDSQFPTPRAGRFREGFPGSATCGCAKRARTGNNYTLLDKALHLQRAARRPKISSSALSEILSITFETASFQFRKIFVPFFIIIDLGHAPRIFHAVSCERSTQQVLSMCGEGLIGR